VSTPVSDPTRHPQHKRGGRGVVPPHNQASNLPSMAQFDVDKMILRFEQRAAAVKDRPLPPVAGEERKRFVEQAESDYTDFLLISKASWSVDDGSLVLTIPLKIPD